MLKNGWPIFVALLAVLVTLVVFLHLGDALHASENQKTIMRACFYGLAIVGVVRVLLRLDPSGLSHSGGSSASSSAQDSTQPQSRDGGE